MLCKKAIKCSKWWYKWEISIVNRQKKSKYTLVTKGENLRKSLLQVYVVFSRNQVPWHTTHFIRTRHKWSVYPLSTIPLSRCVFAEPWQRPAVSRLISVNCKINIPPVNTWDTQTGKHWSYLFIKRLVRNHLQLIKSVVIRNRPKLAETWLTD